MEAISRSCLPEAAARTKRQRKATCCGVLGAASHRTTCSRSSAAKLTSGLILAMRTHISYWPQYIYLFMIHTTRPRGQRGQIKQHGSNWLFVYYLNGKRTHVVLAPVNVYPFRNPEQVREKFSPQISDLHRTANAEVPNAAMLDGLLT